MADQFRLSKIGLVMLGVTDSAKSIAFYRDQLGLKLTAQFEGFAFFDGGGLTLALSQGLAQATGKGAGAVEVVFSVEHVRAAYEALRNQGVQFSSEPRVISPGNWGADFRDPDGHILSIFGPE
ncbi:MAG TPA: VOC family protein [Bryobacteraceae bacterium]|nr:VOC family protein [Bryobacteraceae bacterium]